MKTSIFTFIVSTSLYLLTVAVPTQAQTVNRCIQQAEARRHTALSQAQLAYRNRVTNCQTNTSPDRAEQCVNLARATYERDTQAARARYAADVRACRTQS